MDILESTMLSSSMGQRPAEKLSQSATWAWILCQVRHKARRKVVGLMFTFREEWHRQTEMRPALYSQTYEDKGISLGSKRLLGCSISLGIEVKKTNLDISKCFIYEAVM